MQLVDALSGECCSQFQRERSRTQRSDDVTDDLQRLLHMLDTPSDLQSRECFQWQCRLHILVLPLHPGARGRQQLHQPFHLCRQVPRVPDGRQFQTGVRRLLRKQVHPTGSQTWTLDCRRKISEQWSHLQNDILWARNVVWVVFVLESLA